MRSISLRTRNKEEANRNAKAAKMPELEQAAKINALTAETVTRILVGRKQTGTDAFNAWRDWANVVGLTPNTVTRYETYIGAFLRAGGFDVRSVAGVRDSDVDSFVNPSDDPITANTRRNRLCALHSFFAVAVAKGFVAANPAALIRVKLDGLTFEQKEPKVRTPFTELELDLLRTIDDPFWKTFVLLGEHYGFRVSDVAQLEWSSFAKPGVIVVWTDKRDKRLELPLVSEVAEHVTVLPHVNKTYVFPKERETAIDTALRSKLSLYFGRKIERLGISHGNTHNLRHTFASKRAELGDTVDQIREKLGHTSAETTEGYIHV